jgi:hypothetical protein
MPSKSITAALIASLLLCCSANSNAQGANDVFQKAGFAPLKIYGVDIQDPLRRQHDFVEEEKNRHILIHPEGVTVKEHTPLHGAGPMKIYGSNVEQNARRDRFRELLNETYIRPPIGDFGVDLRLENFYRVKNSPDTLDGLRAPAR